MNQAIKIIFGLLLLPAPAFCIDDNAGTTAGQVIKLGNEARASGLGEAYVALADDAGGFLFNPAGLAGQTGGQLQATHTQWFKDLGLESFNAAFSLGAMGGLGLSFSCLNLPSLARTQQVADTPLPSLNFLETGSLAMRDVCAAAGWAFNATPSLKLGAALKGVSQLIDESTARGAGLDLGLLYSPDKADFGLGLALQNLGLPMVLDQDGFSLPLLWRLGAEGRLLEKSLLLSGELDLPMDNHPVWAMGLEFNIRGTFFPCFGLRLDSMFNPWTAGLGVIFSGLRLDISTMPLGELGQTYRASLAWQYDPWEASRTVENPAVELKCLNPCFSNLSQAAACRFKPEITGQAQARTWRLELWDKSAAPALAFSLRGAGAPGGELAWDGRRENGQSAEEGRYSVVLVVEYFSGQKASSFPQDLEVDNHFPEAELELSPNSLHPDSSRLFMPAEFFIRRLKGHLPARYCLVVSWQDGSIFRTYQGEVEDCAKVVWQAEANAQGSPFISNTDYSVKLSLLDEAGKTVKEYPARTWRCVFK